VNRQRQAVTKPRTIELLLGTACALLLALLLPACASTGGYGLTPVWQQRGYTLNTHAKCLAEPTVLREADISLLLITRAAEEAKLLDYEKARDLLLRPGVCLIAEPEPCCLGAFCAGPNVKAGCSADGWAWVSEIWQGVKRDWSSDQLHELVHVVAYAVGSVYPPNHTGPWAEVERRAQAARAAIKESR
jgi:hypothetical protein